VVGEMVDLWYGPFEDIDSIGERISQEFAADA
jgi:hypothetical protein